MFFKKEKIHITSPIDGEVVALEIVKDEVFSKKMMGDGIAVIPSNSTIVSPTNATVSAVLDANHAIGLVTKDGIELIIHIGLDTVNLKGNGFKRLVNEGDQVNLGDTLLEFDKEKIEREGYDVMTMLVIPNTNHKQLKILKQNKQVKAGITKVIELK